MSVYEGEMSFETYCRFLEERIHLVPRYRQRLAEVIEQALRIYEPPFDRSRPLWESHLLEAARRQLGVPFARCTLPKLVSRSKRKTFSDLRVFRIRIDESPSCLRQGSVNLG